jgi:ankyrin repeat protein
MAESRFCVGFSSACKQAREGGGLPGSEPEFCCLTADGRLVFYPLRPFLPPDVVRLIDALVRQLEHEDMLLRMNGGELGRTLCEAARAGGLLDVRFLLARGADVETTTVNVVEDGDDEQLTSLEWAARLGHLAVCLSLLDAGAVERDWAILLASLKGHTPIVVLLLDRGADINFDDGGALVGAALQGCLATVTLLLDRGADVHTQEDRPLLKSAQCGRLETVRLLLDRGADLSVGDDKPLRSAASKGYLEVVRLLLDRGADVHAGNERALQKARRKGHTAVEALLIERGAREPEN